MEYQVTVDVSDYGYEPENGERFLKGFMEAHSETGPVISQNTETGVLTVLFSFTPEAGSVDGPTQAARLFGHGAGMAGLPPTEVLSFHIDLIRDEEQSEAREAVLA